MNNVVTTITPRKTTDHDLFLNAIKQLNFQKFENLIFNLNINITGNEWKTRGVIFVNCSFAQPIQISDADLGCGIRFINCQIDSLVIFSRCTGSDSDSTFNDRTNSTIYFDGGQINNRILFQQCKFRFGFYAEKGAEFDKVHFFQTNAEKIYFEDCRINGLFEATEVELSSGLRFHKSSVNDQVRFHSCIIDVGFIDSNFTRDIFLSDSTLKYLNLNSHFLDDFIIKGCTISNSFTLYESIFEKALTFSPSNTHEKADVTIKGIWLKDCEFKGGVFFIGEIKKNHLNIERVEVDCTDKLKGNINIENNIIDQFNLSGTLTNGALTIAFCRIRKLSISKWINKGTLSLISLSPVEDPDSFLFFSKSVLGKTLISDCNLHDYRYTTITHTNLAEITTTSVEWFNFSTLNTNRVNDILFSTKTSNMKVDKFFALNRAVINKDLFRQLKFAMEKQGDHFNRLVFRKEEMRAYRQELKLYSFTRKNIGDKAIMFLNQSNDYGFNWIKPIFILLSSTLFFYLVLAICISPDLTWFPDLTNAKATIQYLSKNFYNYFNLLNPAHKVTDIFAINDASKPSIGFYVWDFVERVMLSYLIFQTISAFRKYIK